MNSKQQLILNILKKLWKRQDIHVSIWCALSFIGLGTALVIIGPTILDLAAYISVDLAEIAAMLLVRSIGSVIGSVTAGIFFDRFIKYALWFVIGLVTIGALITCVIPFSTHLAILGVIFICHGFALGGLDTGVHAYLINVWKNKESGPIFQLIHFTFAIGAFLAPLIARPFISSNNGGNEYNITCMELFSMNSTNGQHIYSNDCYRQLINNCSIYYEESSGSSLELILINNCVTMPVVSSMFRYAYWVSVIPLLISLPGLIYYAVKDQCCFDLKQLLSSKKNEKENEDINEKDKTEEEKEKTYPDTIIYKSTLLILLFILILLYVGAEVSYGTYIFAYTVKSDLEFSKEKATIISSLFWGTFAFFRFFSITLSLCKVPPSIMLSANLTGSLLASLIIVFGASNEIAMWIGSGLMGISFASIYPNIVNWLIQHGPATGKATSVLSAGAIIGEMSLPVLVGVLIDKVGPRSLCYFMLANIVVSCGVFIALLIIAYKCRINKDKGKNYYQLQQQVNEEENLEEEHYELTEMITGNNDDTCHYSNEEIINDNEDTIELLYDQQKNS